MILMPVVPCTRSSDFMHPLPTYAGFIPQQPNRTFALARRALLVTVLGARRQSPAGAGGGDELGIETVEPLVEGMSWGTELRGSGRRRRLVRSREEVGDRLLGRVGFRDGCDGFRSLECAAKSGFGSHRVFVRNAARKNPGRVFLRFENGERNRLRLAKSSISPHIDPPASSPGSRSRRLRAAFGREAAGWRATVLRRLPFFCALGGSVASSMWWALPIRSPICCDFCNIL